MKLGSTDAFFVVRVTLAGALGVLALTGNAFSVLVLAVLCVISGCFYVEVVRDFRAMTEIAREGTDGWDRSNKILAEAAAKLEGLGINAGLN